jgi:glucosyl-3-phosphoglycerate synthase
MDETTCRRTAFERLQIPIGYGVEIAPLDDIPPGYGPNGIAQIDLGRRSHSHQSIHDLALMSSELLAAALRRMAVPTPAKELWQFDRASHSQWRRRGIPLTERHPEKISRSAYRIAGPRQRIHLMGEPYCPSSTR